MTDRFVLHPDRIDAMAEGHWDQERLEEILADPDLGFCYDDDGWAARLLVEAAAVEGTGVIESPPGAALWLDLSWGEDRSVYYAFYVTVQRPGLPRLRLMGETEDYPGPPWSSSRGREAVMDLLCEAVAAGNDLLQALEEHCAAGGGGHHPRSSSSDSTDWS